MTVSLRIGITVTSLVPYNSIAAASLDLSRRRLNSRDEEFRDLRVLSICRFDVIRAQFSQSHVLLNFYSIFNFFF